MGKGAKTRKKDTTCVVSFFLQELVKIDIFKLKPIGRNTAQRPFRAAPPSGA